MLNGILYSLSLFIDEAGDFKWKTIVIIALILSVIAACIITFSQMTKKYIDGDEELPEKPNRKKK